MDYACARQLRRHEGNEALSSENEDSPWRSAHFKDGRFFNPGAPRQKFSQFLKWIFRRDLGAWDKPVRIVVEDDPPPARVDGTGLRVTFVGHSTFLLQTAGRNLLTDPVWSERVSPVTFAGPKRHRAPGLQLDELPRIDAILLSHNHYDHFDRATLAQLLDRHRPAVFCPLGLAKPLRRIGFKDICELDWWQHVAWCGLTVHCVPAQHFSARGPFDRNRTLWCGWMLEDEPGSVYFAGDTGFGSLFEEIAKSFPRIRLSLLPIGAYRPEWFMGPIHTSPEQALKAHRILRSAQSIAGHFGTFPLADDGQKDAVERLQHALLQEPSERPFWILKEGEGRDIPVYFQMDTAVE